MSTRAPATTRPGPLALVIRETRYQQLLFWRNRFGAVFTIVFSSLFLVLLSASNTGHISSLHGIDYAQYYTPGFMAYGVMSACFTNLAVSTVLRRETGLLKRLRLSPLPGWALIAAMVLNATLVSVTGAVLLAVIGIVGFGVTLPVGSLVPVALAVIVGAAAFSALGLAVSTIVPNEDAAGPGINIVFFLLLFLSGLWFPLTPGSALAKISNYLPVRRLILATAQPFLGHGTTPWAWQDLGVIVVWGVVGAYFAARRFTWSRWADSHSGHNQRPSSTPR
jgi:ABC-2 type transport system permease protein